MSGDEGRRGTMCSHPASQGVIIVAASTLAKTFTFKMQRASEGKKQWSERGIAIRNLTNLVL